MPLLIDIAGKRFGRLVAISRAPIESRRPKWNCRCDCGKSVCVFGGDLRSGATSSCGCLRNERVRAKIVTHGHAPRSGRRPEYNVWLAMIRRCEHPSAHDRPYYQDRGIKVCQRWREDYAAFFLDMGARPSPKHTIDRINNDGDYESSNCRWATWPQQRRNTRAYIAKHGWEAAHAE